MKPSDGRRTWIKLWVGDWLDGTTRYQTTNGQRIFWIDLLAMAGRSRYGGVVCSGKDGDKWIGYPLAKFQGLLSEPIDVLATFELFRRTGKITFEVDGDALPLYTVFITSWARYQSEYERCKKYRKPKGTPRVTPKVTRKLHAKSRKSSRTEVEVRSEKVDSDTERDSEPESSDALLPSVLTSGVAGAAPPEKTFGGGDNSDHPTYQTADDSAANSKPKSPVRENKIKSQAQSILEKRGLEPEFIKSVLNLILKRSRTPPASPNFYITSFDNEKIEDWRAWIKIAIVHDAVETADREGRTATDVLRERLPTDFP